MAISDHEMIREEEDYMEDEQSGTEPYYDSDDSEKDPTFQTLEGTCLSLSNLSIKKSKSRIRKEVEPGSEEESDFLDVKVPELDESDEKCFEKVQKMVQAGQLEKLKVDQCKVYLRKYGLRLTGKKDVLMERIREHLEIIDGAGEKKYPISSFVLNCKGDACTGDVVMFEQNVYEMFSIASRSATGPPCGTRIVAGRIVKESYGAAKQQHTFTIEVLWSRGEKPLPPLHPLLIKGRNLYRLKTMRQPWADEDERRKVLLEKHSRGHIARCSREMRIQEKEKKKMAIPKRTKRKEKSGIKEQSVPQRQNPIRRSEFEQPNVLQKQQRNPFECNNSGATTEGRSSLPSISSGILPFPFERSLPNVSTGILPCPPFERRNSGATTEHRSRFDGRQRSPTRFNIQERRNINISPPHNIERCPPARRVVVTAAMDGNVKQQHFRAKNYYNPADDGRRPLANLNASPPPWMIQRKLCRFYPQGRCHYGDSCKFLHQ